MNISSHIRLNEQWWTIERKYEYIISKYTRKYRIYMWDKRENMRKGFCVAFLKDSFSQTLSSWQNCQYLVAENSHVCFFGYCIQANWLCTHNMHTQRNIFLHTRLCTTNPMLFGVTKDNKCKIGMINSTSLWHWCERKQKKLTRLRLL